MSHADNSTFTAAERLREQAKGRRKYREALDRAAAVTISLGGIGILATLVLLLVYLIYVVRPLFVPAEISSVVSFSAAPSQAAQAARLPPVRPLKPRAYRLCCCPWMSVQRPYCVSIKVVNSAGLIWVANPSS